MKLKLGFTVKFKKTKLPSKKKLIGKYFFLEPINIKKHSKDLYNNFSLDKKNIIWTYLPYGPFKSHESFKKWLKSFCLNKDPFFYAIYSKKHKGFKPVDKKEMKEMKKKAKGHVMLYRSCFQDYYPQILDFIVSKVK